MIMNTHSYSLHELNEYIKRVIALNFSEPVWINAEISQVKESRGQVYIDLVQHDESDGRIIAQSNAVIWYKSYLFIKNKLKDLLPSILQNGSHIMIKASIEFNERYGLKLVISDIDASYTIGQMEMARQKILERLEKEGLTAKNKALNFPTIIQKIAVISSPTAAGYQDFCRQLEDNSYGYAFQVELYPCAMQGQNVEREVVQALRTINEKNEYDVITIIRGGGSKLDLSYFDNYNIAHAIASGKYPVISGIGHDIDLSVTDVVAHTSLKTPTAVADFLLERNLKFESELIQKQSWVQSIAKQMVTNHKLRLHSFQQILHFMPTEIIRKEYDFIHGFMPDLQKSIKSLINLKNQELKEIQSILQLSDPVNVLKKGYAYIEKNNQVITSSKSLEKGDQVSLHLHDGSIKSEIL